jgi:hypothetical protein
VLTERENELEWLRAPDVAVHCTIDVPGAADAAAVKLTVCGVPGASVIVVGDMVTPVGRPLTATWIVPENPSSAVAESLIDCEVPPAVRLKLVTLTEKEKSGELLTV